MSEGTAKRAAILVVAPEILAELLQLPEGSYIDSALAPHDQPGVLELRICGAGWHVLPGNPITKTFGRVTMAHTMEKVPVIDWRLPNG